MKIEKKCLACKKYRLVDEKNGLCRIDKKENVQDYPIKKHEDSCDRFIDCGQQYYIRIGWLKSFNKKKNKAN